MQADGWSDMPARQSANNTICLKFLVYTMVHGGLLISYQQNIIIMSTKIAI